MSQFRYFLSQTNCRPFVKADVGYGFSTIYNKTGFFINNNSVRGMVFGGGFGFAFFIRDHISIDLGLQYHYYNLKQFGITYDWETDKNYDFSVGKNDVNIFVDFSFYL